MAYDVWTNQQIERLKATYATGSQEDIEREFAPHSWRAIRLAAHRYGLRRQAKRRNWSAICAAHDSTFDFGRHAFK